VDARGVARLLVLGAFVLPGRLLHEAPVLCPFRRLTGRPCPACGLSRSWQAMAHGRLGEAFEQHPLGPLALTATAWFVADDAAEARLLGTDRRLVPAALALWTAVWFWRISRSAPR
jgi:Protein of unknown function (DUF2752)